MANHPGKPGGQRTATLHPLPGEYSAVEPPDPIPNSEVKRSRADGSVLRACESRSSPGPYTKTPNLVLGVFLCLKNTTTPDPETRAQGLRRANRSATSADEATHHQEPTHSTIPRSQRGFEGKEPRSAEVRALLDCARFGMDFIFPSRRFAMSA